MTPEQTQEIIAYGRRGFTPDMIFRTMHKAHGKLHFRRSDILEVLRNAAAFNGYDAKAEHMELGKFSDPDKLRARWAALLPKIRARLRASLGGI